jgi:hypothetical protein
MNEPSFDLQQVVPPDLPGYGPVVFIGQPGSWLFKRAIYLQRVSLLEKLDSLPKNGLPASTRPRHYDLVYIRNI